MQGIKRPPPSPPALLHLQVRVYDKDIFKTDDDLGYAMVPLAGLRDSVDQDLDIPLQGEEDAQRRVQDGRNLS